MTNPYQRDYDKHIAECDRCARTPLASGMCRFGLVALRRADIGMMKNRFGRVMEPRDPLEFLAVLGELGTSQEATDRLLLHEKIRVSGIRP